MPRRCGARSHPACTDAPRVERDVPAETFGSARQGCTTIRLEDDPPGAAVHTEAHPRVAIIANRGPNDFVWEDGQWVTRPSTGGLVSMLEPLARQPDVVWFCCVS